MKPLYSNDKTQQIDRLAAESLAINSFELMQLAGAAVFQHVSHYPRLLVITGPGNNGGDGFVIAELARRNNQQVAVLAMRDLEQLKGDARLAADGYQGKVLTAWPNGDFDCVVDAIFGTGLNQPVRGAYLATIERINSTDKPVLSVDIPSGLNGTTGQIEGTAVVASQTVAILARNTGLYTMDGQACCGDILFEDLGVPTGVYASVEQKARLLDAQALNAIPAARSPNSHKGAFGHVVCVGGQVGMMGAVMLAARAVLKAGAGSATVVTDESHAQWVPLYAPELMSRGYDGLDTQDMNQQLGTDSADVMVMGMGLGSSQWSKHLYKSGTRSQIPLVLDADGLTWLTQSAKPPESLKVITPHPKEAARLLGVDVATIQADRWQAVQQLANRYQCVAVLKGAGTLVSDGETTFCCPYGSANLATAGTGDVLAGMVGGLMAQGFGPLQSAQMAVTWHALAGESSPHGFSMTASDLLETMHHVFN